MTRYPGIADYNRAAQNPNTAFVDSELSTGTLATNGLGLPIALGGGFAVTYMVSTAAEKFAVRCFHRYVPDQKQRYAQISEALGRVNSPHFVAFEYQSDGVRMQQGVFPVLKMAWVEGSTLGTFLEDNYDDPSAIRSLSFEFRKLAMFLFSGNLAHGDIENSNMIVRNGSLALIDYDGMYVPSMPLGNGSELGHSHFQHPGRNTDHFGPRIDDFSFILTNVSLEAIAADKTLYERYCNGDNMLFQKTDFMDPSQSPVFQELRKFPHMRDKVDLFASICVQPIEQVPTLEQFLVECGEPPFTATVAGQEKSAGESNLEFLRRALAPKPSPLQNALSRTVSTGPTAPSASYRVAKTRTAGNVWFRWPEIIVAVLIALAFMYR